MLIKMPTKLRTMDEHNENLNKGIENIKRNDSELKNAITEIH